MFKYCISQKIMAQIVRLLKRICSVAKKPSMTKLICLIKIIDMFSIKSCILISTIIFPSKLLKDAQISSNSDSTLQIRAE